MKTTILPTHEKALQDNNTPMSVTNKHFVTGNPIQPPFPGHFECALFGLGCFWGVERRFWQLKGVYSTAVGYAAGITANPTYEQVCTGQTGHNEVVLIVFDPQIIPYRQLLQQFWESHNPTQGMRQGNDTGSQYRSGIYTYNLSQHDEARASRDHYQIQINQCGFSKITTEIIAVSEFYYAEDYHQAYLAKNPGGYCGIGGLGVSFQ